VPELIRYYLGDDPILPNVDTYLLLGTRSSRAALIASTTGDQPVAESGGYGMLMPGSPTQRWPPCGNGSSRSRNYIAQKSCPLAASHLSMIHLEGRHIDLRRSVVG